jgi:hypothetical protein
LYLYKKYAENEIERYKQAGDEWFTDESEQGVPGEDETDESGTDEQAAPGEVEQEEPTEPTPGKPAITLDELVNQVESTEQAKEKRLQKRISHLTPIQQ